MWGVLLALTVTTAFLIVSPPLYRSEATLFVRTPGDVSQVQDGGDSYAQGRAQTYAALANNTTVAARVIADLGLDLKPEVLSERISATHPTGTALIHVALSAPSAQQAQRTLGVLLSEYAADVRALESVPGSLVPRAELVIVDPPDQPARIFAWGVPIPIVLLGAALFGLLMASLAAVVAVICTSPSHSTPSTPNTPFSEPGPERDSLQPSTPAKPANEGTE
jgi:capsular polysaccharide biosynthesis protein